MEKPNCSSVVLSGLDNYQLEFEAEKIKFLKSPLWNKLLKDFVKSVKLEVAEEDVEALKKFLRVNRTEVLEIFKKKGCYYIWDRCFNMEINAYDGGAFMKKLHACNEDGIEQSDLEDVFTYLCMTENIEIILKHTLAFEKQDTSSGTIAVFINQMVYNNGTISFSPTQNDNHKETGAEAEEDEILRNVIFSERLFVTNNHLHRLRNEIGKSIDFGDYNPVFGDVERPKINPAMQNEWYYILKGISESGVCNKRFTVQDFIDQMIRWYPWAFASFQTLEEKKTFKEKMGKSISHEKKIWRYGSTKEEVPIKDMWAKWKVLNIDFAKVAKFQPVCRELSSALLKLKSTIEQEAAEKSAR